MRAAQTAAASSPSSATARTTPTGNFDSPIRAGPTQRAGATASHHQERAFSGWAPRRQHERPGEGERVGQGDDLGAGGGRISPSTDRGLT
ncbi:hypothetical protein GCM10020219_006970 [Nonomuraea dietziae]